MYGNNSLRREGRGEYHRLFNYSLLSYSLGKGARWLEAEASTISWVKMSEQQRRNCQGPKPKAITRTGEGCAANGMDEPRSALPRGRLSLLAVHTAISSSGESREEIQKVKVWVSVRFSITASTHAARDVGAACQLDASNQSPWREELLIGCGTASTGQNGLHAALLRCSREPGSTNKTQAPKSVFSDSGDR